MNTSTNEDKPQAYIYLGDRNTDAALKNQQCIAVKNDRKKCMRGKNGSMLVEFADGNKHVVMGKLLRKIKGDSK